MINNKCRLVNIIWIERGILLVIMGYILKKYKKLLDKTIIIENEDHRKFIKMLFPKHKFSSYAGHMPHNFYFNVRRVLYPQDIVIDYVSNYNDIINTKKVNLVPWYDMNDVLIYYKISSQASLNIKKLLPHLLYFSKCTRGNFGGYLWDAYTETDIIRNYTKVNKHVSEPDVLQIINAFLTGKYVFVSSVSQRQHPQIYYVRDNSTNIGNNGTNTTDNIASDERINQEIERIRLENDANINTVIELISNKLSLLNNIE